MRLLKSKMLVALAVAAGISVNGFSFAEEQQQFDPQIQALIERLDAAEKQIQSLNSELEKVKSKQNTARPFPNELSEPQTLPISEGSLPLAVDGVFKSEQRTLNLGTDFSGSVVVPIPIAPSVAREELAAFQDAVTSNSNDLEQRLGTLEEGWAELDAAWGKFNASEKKKKSDAAKKPSFKIGGRIHADYWDFVNASQGINNFEHPVMGSPNFGTAPEDRAAFRRIRMEMKGDLLETMLWKMQIDFAVPSIPLIKDVYIGFKELPNNQTLLIGNQKRPLGLDHLNSSRFNVFMERPLVVEAFNEDARRPGIAMYGHTDDLSMNWRYGAYFLETVTADGAVKGNSSQMSLNARLAGSPWYDEASGGRGYFHWGLAGMVARPDGNASGVGSNANEARFRTRVNARSDSRWLNTGRIGGTESYEVLGLETIFNHGPFQVVSEYQGNWLQRDNGGDLFFQGAYVYLSYFLTGEHIPYDRASSTLGRVKPFENFFLVGNSRGGTSTGWGAWNVALRYDYLNISDDDIQGGTGTALTSAVNWWWTPYSRVQFNASYGDLSNHAPVGGLTSGNYFILGTRFAVDF